MNRPFRSFVHNVGGSIEFADHITTGRDSGNMHVTRPSACSEVCCGGWRVCRCQPDRRGTAAKPIWTTEEVEGEVSEKSLRIWRKGWLFGPGEAQMSAPNGSIIVRSREGKNESSSLLGDKPFI